MLITSADILDRPSQIHSYLMNGFNLSIDIIECRSADEGWCNVVLENWCLIDTLSCVTG